MECPPCPTSQAEQEIPEVASDRSRQRSKAASIPQSSDNGKIVVSTCFSSRRVACKFHEQRFANTSAAVSAIPSAIRFLHCRISLAARLLPFHSFSQPKESTCFQVDTTLHFMKLKILMDRRQQIMGMRHTLQQQKCFLQIGFIDDVFVFQNILFQIVRGLVTQSLSQNPKQ